MKNDRIHPSPHHTVSLNRYVTRSLGHIFTAAPDTLSCAFFQPKPRNHPCKPAIPASRRPASPYCLFFTFINFFCMPQHAKTWLRISGSVIAGKWRVRMGFAQGAREGANLVIAPTAATAAPTPLSLATFPARSAYPSPQACHPRKPYHRKPAPHTTLQTARNYYHSCGLLHAVERRASGSTGPNTGATPRLVKKKSTGLALSCCPLPV